MGRCQICGRGRFQLHRVFDVPRNQEVTVCRDCQGTLALTASITPSEVEIATKAAHPRLAYVGLDQEEIGALLDLIEEPLSEPLQRAEATLRSTGLVESGVGRGSPSTSARTDL